MYFHCFYCPMQYFYRQYSREESYPQTSTSDIATSRPPTGPPPPFIPSKTQAMYETWGAGPGTFMLITPPVLQTYMFRYVYIWLKNGSEFWGWINHVDQNFASGFRWNGSSWVPFRINIRAIDGAARF